MANGEVSASFTSPVVRPVLLRQFGSYMRADPQALQAPPVLSLIGPGGVGKTAILRQLSAEIEQLTPRAYVDCTAEGIGSLADLLKVVKFLLSRHCPSVGRLWFARLEIALIALAGRTAFPNDRRGMREFERTIVNEMAAVPGPLSNLAGAVSSDLVGYLVGFPLETTGAEIGQAVSGVVSRQRAESKLVRRALDWFGHRDRNRPRRPLDALLEIGHFGGQQADELLIDAFFADLRDGYRPERLKIPWWNNAVLLLDNADSTLGRYFLTLVRQHQAQHPLGNEPLLIAMAGRTANRSIDTESLPPRDFTEDEVDQLASPVPEATDPRFGKLVHCLTEGFPSAAAALVNAQCEHRVDVEGGLLPLLSATIEDSGAGEDTTVEQRMFDSLELSYLRRRGETERFEALLDALTTCAASRSLTEATDLLRTFHGDGLVTDQQLAATLFWNSKRSTSGLALLRWLFLRRLARRRPGDTDWRTVFEHLHRTTDDPTDRVYYAMALERVAEVSEHLTDRLAGTGTEQSWLDLVREVGTAPCRSELSNPNQLLKTLTAPVATARATHRYEVARVVTGMWLTGQRHVGPARHYVHGELKTDLTMLVPYADDDEELTAEAERQRDLREAWSPGPRSRRGGNHG